MGVTKTTHPFTKENESSFKIFEQENFDSQELSVYNFIEKILRIINPLIIKIDSQSLKRKEMQNLKSQLLNTSLLLLACFTILVNAQNTFYNPEGYIEYIVSVRTGDMKNAGTNNQIYITIFGETGETRGVLMNPLIKGNPFEKGKTDKAHFNAKDVGPVTSVTIYVQSNTAFGGDWYLDEIEVERLGQGDKKYNFVIGRWLESGGFSFELAEKTHELKVTVRTSDIRKAGTDADVFIRLHGSLDKTAWMQLDAGDRNLFER